MVRWFELIKNIKDMMNNLQSSAFVAKNLLNVLQGYIKGIRFVAVLTMLLTVGIGSAWGATVTYTVSSTTSVTKSGTAPIDATASYNQTYSTAKQLTKNNSATLTLTKLGGINISNLTLSMKSNGSGGSGKLSYSIDGGSTWTYLVGSSSSGLAFSHANWNGKYTTSYTNISKDVTINNATQLKIKIEATANSLYCESYTITYTDATPKQEYTLSYQAGENNGTLPVEEGANLLDALGELDTPTSCDATSTTFVGWTATEITEKTNKAPTFITSTDIMPSADFAVFAVFAENSGGASFDGTTSGNFKIYAIVKGTKYYAKGTGSKISSTTEESDATEYTFAKTSSGFTIKTGTSYITYSSSTNLGTSTTAYNWDISEGTNGSWRITSVASTARGIVFRAGSSYNQFGGYALSNVSAGSTEYFDVEIGSSPSYSNFITSCTTQTVLSLRPQPAYRHSVKNLPFL